MSIVKICGAGTEDDQIMKDVQYCTKEFALDPKGHVYVLAKSLQSCPTVCNPMYCSPLSKGLSRQEYWSGLPCPPPGNLPDPGVELASLMSPALVGRFFTTSTTWEAPKAMRIY